MYSFLNIFLYRRHFRLVLQQFMCGFFAHTHANNNKYMYYTTIYGFSNIKKLLFFANRPCEDNIKIRLRPPERTRKGARAPTTVSNIGQFSGLAARFIHSSRPCARFSPSHSSICVGLRCVYYSSTITIIILRACGATPSRCTVIGGSPTCMCVCVIRIFFKKNFIQFDGYRILHEKGKT